MAVSAIYCIGTEDDCSSRVFNDYVVFGLLWLRCRRDGVESFQWIQHLKNHLIETMSRDFDDLSF